MASYFVSGTGNDTFAGSQISPFFSVAKGVSVLVPGDSLAIRGGAYFESIPTPANGLAASPITISAFPSEVVVIQPLPGSQRVVSFASAIGYVRIVNLVLDGINVSSDGVKITTGAHHITLEGCEVKNVPNAQGILITNALSVGNIIRRCKLYNNGSTDQQHHIYIQTSGNLVEQCEVFGGSGYAIHQFGVSTSGNVYRRNKVHNTFGILAASGMGTQVHYNVLYSNLGDIAVGNDEDEALILNNTCYNGPRGIFTDSSVTNTVIRNNISFLHTDLNGDYIDQGTGTIQDHNAFTINPLFVNAGASDFHLLNGSPAINAGIGVGLSMDYDGVTVGSSPEIGAFEFVAPIPPPLPPGESGQGYNRIQWGMMRRMLLDRLDSKGVFYRDS